MSERVLYSGYKKCTTLKYEVAVCAQTGVPIAFNGPFAGPTSDITIFRKKLKKTMILHGLLGLADGTYQGEGALLLVPPRPYSSLDPNMRDFYRRCARKRILSENLFSRTKSFAILSTKFRHDLSLHRSCFKFILNIICIDLEFYPLRIK